MRIALLTLWAVAVLGGCGSDHDAEGGVGRPGPEGQPADENDETQDEDPNEAAAGSAAEGSAAAGSGADDPGGSGSVNDPSVEPPMMAMDECDLDTGWEGDEYCILP